MSKPLYLLIMLLALSLMSGAAWLATLYGPSTTADLVGLFGAGLLAFLTITTIADGAAVPYATHDPAELGELQAPEPMAAKKWAKLNRATGSAPRSFNAELERFIAEAEAGQLEDKNP